MWWRLIIRVLRSRPAVEIGLALVILAHEQLAKRRRPSEDDRRRPHPQEDHERDDDRRRPRPWHDERGDDNDVWR